MRRQADPSAPALLADLHRRHPSLARMLNEIKTWVPGVTFYVLGAIAPALMIVLMTQ